MQALVTPRKVDTLSSELRLLMASARAVAADEIAIRAILQAGIDWTEFARLATEHQVACLCGATLSRIAPDLIPQDILQAFAIALERTRTSNRAALKRLRQLTAALERHGIEVIALRGPVLAQLSFADVGLRAPGRCDLLVRAPDAPLVAAMADLARRAGGIELNVVTDCTSGTLALDLPGAALWARAQRIDLEGHPVLTLAPEDALLLMAVYGTERRWARIQWAADIAAFIGAHATLDWRRTLDRARAIGCLRMLALALALARRYLGANVPEAAAASLSDRIESRTQRIGAQWQAPAPPAPASARGIDLLRLHQGAARQGRYLARALVVPGWRQLVSVPDRAAADDGRADLRSASEDRRRAQELGAWIDYAQTLFDAKQFSAAVEASDQALALDPSNVEAMHRGIFARLKACDWRRLDEDQRSLADCIQRRPQVIWPSLPQLLDFDTDPKLEHLAIQQIPASGHASLPPPLWRGERYQHGKIRVAYVSGSLASDPMAALATGLFEHHDKAQFEITAVSLGRNARTPMRARIEAASKRFIQADQMSNEEVAATLHDLQVDIAVDLNGYTGKRNAAILAYRLAPVQLNLGYPGTMALPYMDYMIADRIALPPEHQARFSEQVVYLPHSFQPNDRDRPTPEATPSRSELGLPERGFVFACFNTSYKIRPRMFDIWMRLLQGVEGSVLWLLEDNRGASANLRREARMRGIDPQRLIFAPRTLPALNMARQRRADLFLDTLPMNAQATASDALWAGLPVLTCLGTIFRARVAASLLYALDLPELVTASLDEYEQLGLALAHDADRLAAIKAKLARSRASAPLFDTARYTRHLESAYRVMAQRARSGLPPVAFAVDG